MTTEPTTARGTEYVMVPREPTDDMLVFGQEAWLRMRPQRNAIEDCKEAEAVWTAMLAAAPHPAPSAVAGERAIVLPPIFSDAEYMLIARLNDGVRFILDFKAASPSAPSQDRPLLQDQALDAQLKQSAAKCDQLPQWMKDAAGSAPSQGQEGRKFCGVGELESSGYIPAGSAVERETTPPAPDGGEPVATVCLVTDVHSHGNVLEAQLQVMPGTKLPAGTKLYRRPSVPDGGESVDKDDLVKWIVNDLGELGVLVAGRALFLYKGHCIEYTSGEHDDGTPMLFRGVGKREFGETQWPAKWLEAGRSEDRYTQELVYRPGLSDGPPDNPIYQWRPLSALAVIPNPSAPKAADPEQAR